MELDTGATLSVISEQTYHKLFSNGKAPTLKTVTTKLTTYTGETIDILGEVYRSDSPIQGPGEKA